MNGCTCSLFSKLKLAAHSFGLPTLCLLIFVIKQVYPGFIFNEYVALGLLTGSLLRLLVRDTKYLIGASIEENRVRITYFNALFQRRSFEAVLEDIQLEYSQEDWLTGKFDLLLVHNDHGQTKFQIANKQVLCSLKNGLVLRRA